MNPINPDPNPDARKGPRAWKYRVLSYEDQGGHKIREAKIYPGCRVYYLQEKVGLARGATRDLKPHWYPLIFKAKILNSKGKLGRRICIIHGEYHVVTQGKAFGWIIRSPIASTVSESTGRPRRSAAPPMQGTAEELLAMLKKGGDKAHKRKIRAALRLLGVRGGLRAQKGKA